MHDVPVIDLFAGPGGLSHGFSSLIHKNLRFNIRLSIEKDPIAYKTLRLRAFLRQFEQPPEEYYSYIRREKGIEPTILKDTYPDAWAAAEQESKQWELGVHPFGEVSTTITQAVGKATRWILLGGPPCQAYSLAGRSRRTNDKEFSKDERHTLYREYLKIVAVNQPTLFIMENVKGILSAVHGTNKKTSSIFHRILTDLRNPGDAVREEPDVRLLLPNKGFRYKIYSFVTKAPMPEALEPNDFVICSEDWGVPQRRHRVILLGVRDDLTVEPKTLADFFSKSNITVEEVIDDLPALRSRLSNGNDSSEAWLNVLKGISQEVIESIRDKRVRGAIRTALLRLRTLPHCGEPFLAGRYRPARLSRWLYDPKLMGVIQHESRAHMGMDLVRYLFAACAAAKNGYSPKLGEYPTPLLPKHRNAKPHAVLNRSKSHRLTFDFDDRFRVQVRGQPATTIVSHIAKDGHYYIHYDPLQCRSLTVREVARLQTFPDSYFFEGDRTPQYRQVGNAVPPLLAKKLATVAADLLVRDSSLLRTIRKRN